MLIEMAIAPPLVDDFVCKIPLPVFFYALFSIWFLQAAKHLVSTRFAIGFNPT
jgi:hypothetical protein